MLILVVGLPKSGSSWMYHMVNDVVVAAGYDDAAAITERYQLGDILKFASHNLQEPDSAKLARLTSSPVGDHCFTVKTHFPPSPLLLDHIAAGRVRVILTIRDPRDMAVSAFETGCSHRAAGRQTFFARIADLPSAIDWAVFWLRHSYDPWSQVPGLLTLRYEDMMIDPARELSQINTYLGFSLTQPLLQEIADKWWRPDPAAPEFTRLHFNRGTSGRHRQVFASADEQEMLLRIFGEYLQRMGYSPASD